MKKDILVAGVGGQGILSVAFVLDNAVMDSGLYLKQTEVHGMAQRGGGVVSHVRISDSPIHSDMIPIGQCDIILGVEPIEALRYTNYMHKDAFIIANTEPLVNIPNYPDLEKIISKIKSNPKNITLNATQLAKKAGHANAQNIVLLGALSKFIDVEEEKLLKWIKELFKAKGDKIVQLNLDAFQFGKEATA